MARKLRACVCVCVCSNCVVFSREHKDYLHEGVILEMTVVWKEEQGDCCYRVCFCESVCVDLCVPAWASVPVHACIHMGCVCI